jgi:hypothetical protein
MECKIVKTYILVLQGTNLKPLEKRGPPASALALILVIRLGIVIHGSGKLVKRALLLLGHGPRIMLRQGCSKRSKVRPT